MADSKMIPTGRRYCNAQFRIANAKVTTSLPGNKPDGSICPQGTRPFTRPIWRAASPRSPPHEAGSLPTDSENPRKL